MQVSCQGCGTEVTAAALTGAGEVLPAPVFYGQDGYFFTPDRLAVWDRELRAGGFDVRAMPVMSVGPLLAARYGLGAEQGRIAGLALRKWMAGVRS